MAATRNTAWYPLPSEKGVLTEGGFVATASVWGTTIELGTEETL